MLYSKKVHKKHVGINELKKNLDYNLSSLWLFLIIFVNKSDYITENKREIIDINIIWKNPRRACKNK